MGKIGSAGLGGALASVGFGGVLGRALMGGVGNSVSQALQGHNSWSDLKNNFLTGAAGNAVAYGLGKGIMKLKKFDKFLTGKNKWIMKARKHNPVARALDKGYKALAKVPNAEVITESCYLEEAMNLHYEGVLKPIVESVSFNAATSTFFNSVFGG